MGFENTFSVHLEDSTEDSNSSTSTPTYPPGFEPDSINLKEVTDDAISPAPSQGVVPKRLRNEYRRLGIPLAETRRTIVKKVIQLYKVPIILLQETKMMHCSDYDIYQICGSKNYGWTFQQSMGNSGGMIILWNKYLLDVFDCLVGDYSISVACINKTDNFKWSLTSVYGPNNPYERPSFWEELDNVCSFWNLPWCIGVDFNTILKCDEKKNCKNITKSMKGFASFIDEHDLIDLSLKGARYTWSNNQSNPIMCKLDRFLFSPSLELQYPCASQLDKPRPTSDHIPILLDIDDPSWGPSPFRFEIMCFLENGFVEMLELKWKALKEKLKEWNKETFGHTNKRLNTILSNIQMLDIAAEDTPLCEIEVFKKIAHKAEFERISLMKETAWRIKSKSKWIKEGDRNIASFMKMTTARRRHNNIKQLYVDGVLTDDKFQLQDHIVNFYKHLFTEQLPIRPELDGIDFNSISSCESEILDVIFTEEEVLSSIKNLAHDKAPGPNGLKLVMDKLISPVQCANVEGRQITDGILIANEQVDSRLISGSAGIICKIDLEKAFDRVNWHYLEVILKKMGFSAKWCNWGVRQGDPLFPLLFNISMEGFSRYIDRAANLKLFSGFSVSQNGLKINTSKTRLITIGDCPDLSDWAVEIGCATDKLPFQYLGMPLGAKENSKTIWDPILVKSDDILSLWKKSSYTKGELAPSSVIMKLEKKMRDFLWEHNPSSKTSHLVNYDLVCASKSRGGLGVLNLKAVNSALLSKCISCWKTIAEERFLIDKYSTLSVHGGTNISFWFDNWCVDNPLMGTFPSLFKLSRERYTSVAAHISDSRSWVFYFKRRLTDNETDKLALMFLQIGTSPPILDSLPDTRRWSLSNNGVFSVKTLYARMIASDGVDDFPHSFV
ncbi:uncharacterized protein LOC113351613 [Papaver somniferum]|uniref:uncharacterized protein LOC113351613 n=1 Tax=Papaver somniferum TaxID=3469 RepID=UPI000E7002E3|nr:uncharacterized protein LOC113351613 [Papaver somniferum]